MYGTNPVNSVDFNTLADQVVVRAGQSSVRPPEDTAPAASASSSTNSTPVVTPTTATARAETGQAPPSNNGGGRTATTTSTAAPSSTTSTEATPGTLSVKDQAVMSELSRIDQEVRVTATNHAIAGSGVTSGTAQSSSGSRGNDAAAYAVTTEIPVALRTNPLDPSQTLRSAQAVMAAALPPPTPTAETLAKASQAEALAAQARADIAKRLAAAHKSSETGGEGLQNPDKLANQVVQSRALNVRV